MRVSVHKRAQAHKEGVDAQRERNERAGARECKGAQAGRHAREFKKRKKSQASTSTQVEQAEKWMLYNVPTFLNVNNSF